MTGSAQSPLISVIVPCFNNASTVGACIESLLALEAEPGEVQAIVVDNGSSDESIDIASRYADIALLKEPEPGAYPARNTGLKVARAPIVAFTDADCTVDPDWFQVIRRRLEEPALAMMIGHVRFPAAASLPLRMVGAWENAKADFIAHHCPPENRIAYCNNLAVRAELFDALGPFSPWRRAGDSEFAHRVAQARPELGFVFEPAMRVTHHEFLRARERTKRLRRYTQTNQQIESFRELSNAQRLRVAGSLLRGGGR